MCSMFGPNSEHRHQRWLVFSVCIEYRRPEPFGSQVDIAETSSIPYLSALGVSAWSNNEVDDEVPKAR
jgi:hypothetical protein